MSTKKDQGNSLYKKQKYAQAVAAYKQYIKYNHSDNSKAYNNMALCYFKMKNYKQCIQACQASIQLEPQFQKPYFRMYQAYKQLKDYYNLLISGNKFIKYSKQQKQVKQIQKQLIIYKQNLSYGTRPEQSINQIYKPIQQIMELTKFQLPQNSEVKQAQCSLQTKWQRIQIQIKQNPRKGINSAWKFISDQCNDQEQQKKYKKLLIKLKSSNLTPNNAQKSPFQKSSSSESFEYLTVSKQQFEPLIQQQQKNQSEVEQNKLIQTDNKTQTLTQNNQVQSQLQEQNNSKQADLEQNSQIELSDVEIKNLFEQKLKNKLKNSSDQFNCFYVNLCEIISSKDLNKSQKRTLLMKIPQKLTRFTIFTNSLSKSQKQNLKLLSKSNNVFEIIQKIYIFKK